MQLHGHEVIGHQVVNQNGCFSIEKFWIRGYVRGLPERQVAFVKGWQGEETCITRDIIRPYRTVEVVSQ